MSPCRSPAAHERAALKQERWNEKWRERLGDGYHDASRHLVAEVEVLEPGRVLDVACGLGRNAIWLAERGWRVTGVDYSEVALAEAGRRAAARGLEIEWVLADVTDWVPEAAAYDLVCVMYLQIPAGERRVVLERAAEALSPGGVILVVGHDLRNLAEGCGGPSDPDVHLTPELVVAGLVSLQIDRAESVVRHVEDENGAHEAIDTLVRAHRSDA
jgi:2-polyprenyl-3-methyl-5-hydroxy-6-metoxy-1,4-benzoquinol methylase